MTGTFMQRDGRVTSAATDDMPERIWAWPNDVEDGFMAACRQNEPPPKYADGSHIEYVRADLHDADLPPTPAEAMRCPEVAVAIAAMRELIVAHASGWIDGEDWGAGSRARDALAALEGAKL